MHLVLLQNDPTHTKYATPEGDVVYQTRTTSQTALPSLTSVIRHARLDEKRQTFIPEEKCTDVGLIEHRGGSGTYLTLTLGARCLMVEGPNLGRNLMCPRIDERESNNWSFTGPDQKQYIWTMFLSNPMCLTNDNRHRPIARYHTAKLGIISRSRKASLEIFPDGMDIMDMVIVTFISFMKQRITNVYYYNGGNPTSSSEL